MLFAGTGCQPSATDPRPEVASARADVQALLDAQVAAWNQGDIEGFMAGYARTDSVRYVTGGTAYYGWETALERYRRSYPDRAAMGTLAFDGVDVRVVSPRWATVFGTWRLQRTDDVLEGRFTLLIERRAGAWRIVHDHTSSAE